jgi:hypothetical protein
MSEPESIPIPELDNTEGKTEWVKPRISDEEITKMQEKVKEMETRLENSVNMIHQRDVIIRKMAQILESYGINMVVLARNSQGLIDQSAEIGLE